MTIQQHELMTSRMKMQAPEPLATSGTYQNPISPMNSHCNAYRDLDEIILLKRDDFRRHIYHEPSYFTSILLTYCQAGP
jgi:hypothetical protein